MTCISSTENVTAAPSSSHCSWSRGSRSSRGRRCQRHILSPGDHVVACLSMFCGLCHYCLSGRPHLCIMGQSLLTRNSPALRTAKGDPVIPFASLGTFAEQMLVHEHMLVKIPIEMPLDAAALMGCGVTTGLGAVFRTADIRPAILQWRLWVAEESAYPQYREPLLLVPIPSLQWTLKRRSLIRRVASSYTCI